MPPGHRSDAQQPSGVTRSQSTESGTISAPRRARRRRLRGIVVNALLLIVTTLIMFVVAEGLLRVRVLLSSRGSGSLSEDLERSNETRPAAALGAVSIGGLVRSSQLPDVVYELKPNVRAEFQGQPYESNEWGMRDRSYPREKSSRTFRIAGIGDSVMFGWGVPIADTYLERLERDLSERAAANGGPPVEVLNFAVPGYNTAMEIALFEHRVLAFTPDLVVVHFVSNDYNVPLFMARPSDPYDTGRSYLLDLMENAVRRLRGGVGDDALVGANLDGMNDTERQDVLDQYRHMVGERAWRIAMRRLAKLTGPRNIPVVVLAGSVRGGMQRRLRRTCKMLGFHLIEIREHVNRELAARGIPNTVDERKKALQVSAYDSHPNSLGHEIYAKALRDYLASSSLIPVALR